MKLGTEQRFNNQMSTSSHCFLFLYRLLLFTKVLLLHLTLQHKEERRVRREKMCLHSVHPVVTGYNRLVSSVLFPQFPLPPSHTHTHTTHLLYKLVIISPPCQLVLVLGPLLVLLSLSRQCLPLLLLLHPHPLHLQLTDIRLLFL